MQTPAIHLVVIKGWKHRNRKVVVCKPLVTSGVLKNPNFTCFFQLPSLINRKWLLRTWSNMKESGGVSELFSSLLPINQYTTASRISIWCGWTTSIYWHTCEFLQIVFGTAVEIELMKVLEYSDVYAPRYGVLVFLCVVDTRVMLWAFYAATAVGRTRGRLYAYH